MTDEAEQPTRTLSPLEAQLLLEVAVQQLLTPTVERIDRSRPEVDPQVAQVDEQADRDHHDRMTRLRTRHAAALAARDKAGARRAISRMLEAEHQHRRAAAERTRTDVLIPSLLTRLQAAVESTQGYGSRGGGVHRAPIGLAAAELLGEIERTVGHRYSCALSTDVRSWAAGRRDGEHTLVAAADLATRWVEDTRAIVDPDRTFEIAGACPLCLSRWVWVDDGEQRIRKAALQVTFATRSARCISPGCTGRWPREYLDHLARVVVQDRTERRTG